MLMVAPSGQTKDVDFSETLLFVSAQSIVTGSVAESDVQAAIEALNPTLPHYQRVRAHHIQEEPFSIENGFLTANGKLKRQLVLERLEPQIEHMYSGSGA